MKIGCTKFRNFRPYTAKALPLWKMFDNPTENHTDTEVTYTISFIREAKNIKQILSYQ